MPIAVKTAIAWTAGCDSVNPSAEPMKGAVHGVATSTARQPDPKAPGSEPPAMRLASPAPPRRVNPRPISKTPEKFRPTARKSKAIAATKAGDCN